MSHLMTLEVHFVQTFIKMATAAVINTCMRYGACIVDDVVSVY